MNIDIFWRVEAAGFKALAFTVDTSVWGKWDADMRNKFALPEGIEMEVYKQYLTKDTLMKKSKGESAINEFVNSFKDNSFTFERIKEIWEMTKLPIILKGI